jgi:LysM repeat protein
MRLRLVLAAIVALAAAVVVPDALAAPRNPQTAGLQVALRAQGLYHGAIDAIAGPETAAAVRAFQRSHHLRVTGRADRRTRAELGPLGRPLFGTRTLRRGDFGWDVAVLQFLLVRRGISVPVNAYFDGPTLRGVRSLQRRIRLQPDGVVGRRTLAALGRHVSARLVRVSSTKPSVKIHVVRPGESLWVLAKRYHTTIAKLARLNHLDPKRALLVGTKLRVPAVPRRVNATPTADRTGGVSSVRALLDRWAAHYGISVHLVRALAWMESGYNNALVSSTGARGIMQVEPYTWRFVEEVLIGHHVRHDAAGNVRVGVAYLQHLLRDFHGNRRLALAAWYQGEGAVRQHGVLTVSRQFVADVLALAQRM